MSKYDKCLNNVMEACQKFPGLLKVENINFLYWYYWITYDKVIKSNEDPLYFKDFNKCTSPETISRSRRKFAELLGFKTDVSISGEVEALLEFGHK